MDIYIYIYIYIYVGDRNLKYDELFIVACGVSVYELGDPSNTTDVQ